MLFICDSGCEVDIGMSRARVQHRCEPHGLVLRYSKPLARNEPPARTTKPRKAMKRGKGFAASKEQRDKVRNLPCVVCGQNAGFDIGDGGGSFVVDPAHLYPRSLCPCEHAEGVIPLCRAHHRIYDDASERASLDLLPKLIDRGYFAELAHPISAHSIGPVTVLEHVTGETWTTEPSSPQLPVGRGMR